MKTILTTLTLQIMRNMHKDLGLVEVVITKSKPPMYLMQVIPKHRNSLKVLRSKGIVIIQIRLR